MSALREAWKNGRKIEEKVTEQQKEAMKALFEIECRMAEGTGTDTCDGPWCGARDKIREAFKETEDEWDVQLPAKK